jgi:hypothetical protein
MTVPAAALAFCGKDTPAPIKLISNSPRRTHLICDPRLFIGFTFIEKQFINTILHPAASGGTSRHRLLMHRNQAYIGIEFESLELRAAE